MTLQLGKGLQGRDNTWRGSPSVCLESLGPRPGLQVIIFTGNTAKPATQQLCLAGKLPQTADVSQQWERGPLLTLGVPAHPQ